MRNFSRLVALFVLKNSRIYLATLQSDQPTLRSHILRYEIESLTTYYGSSSFVLCFWILRDDKTLICDPNLRQ